MGSQEMVEPYKINLFSVYDIEKLSFSIELFVSTFALSETTEFVQNTVGRVKNFFDARHIYITGQLEEEREDPVWQAPKNIITSAINRLKDVRISRFHIGHNYELTGSSELPGLTAGTIEKKPSENVYEDIKTADQGQTAGLIVRKTARRLDCTLRIEEGLLQKTPSVASCDRVCGKRGSLSVCIWAAAKRISTDMSTLIILRLSIPFKRGLPPISSPILQNSTFLNVLWTKSGSTTYSSTSTGHPPWHSSSDGTDG